jgi:hypothetical protein
MILTCELPRGFCEYSFSLSRTDVEVNGLIFGSALIIAASGVYDFEQMFGAATL